jgi:hypothetical protein
MESFVTGWASQDGLYSTELVDSTAREVNIKQNRSLDMNGENGNTWKEVVMDYGIESTVLDVRIGVSI